MKFNLNSFIKEAMGAPAWRYRSEIKWCRIEDAVRGTPIACIEGDENSPDSPVRELTWSELKAKEKNGVRSSLYEILNFKAKVEKIFRARYKMEDRKLKEFFQLFVGYHPFYGVYMCSVGPYFAKDNMWGKMRLIAGEREIDNAFLDEVIASTEQRVSESTDPEVQEELMGTLSAARSVKADLTNRFGFFTKRNQRATKEEIQKSAENFIRTAIAQLSEVMDISDIQLGLDDVRLILKKATGGQRGTETIGYNGDVYNGLSDTSTDAQELFKNRPILGAGSEIQLKPNVLSNIILKSVKSGNWQSIYDEALSRIAKKNLEKGSKKVRGVAPVSPVVSDDAIREEVSKISELLQSESFDSEGIIKQVLEFSHGIRKEMVARGEINAELIKLPSVDFKIMKKPKVGSVMPTTLGIKADQLHLAELRAEVLDVIAKEGTDNPKKISEILNSGIRGKNINNLKAKGRITEQEVEQVILRCQAERKVRVKGQFAKQKSYTQLAAESKKQLEDFKNALDKKDLAGFTNLEETFVMACLSLSSPGADAIDPQTKGSIPSLFMPPPDLFRRGENFVNYTSEQLTSARRNELEEEEVFKNIKIASPKEIEAEIGITDDESVIPEEEEATQDVQDPEAIEDLGVPSIDSVEQVDQVAPVDSVEQVDQVAPVEQVTTGDQPISDFPITEVPQQTEDSQVSPEPPVQEPASKPRKKIRPSDFAKLVSNSIGTLIKIAKDLDQKGKYAESEEVHKIIRKYQKGL